MRKQKNWKRLLSTVLSLALVFSMTGTPVFATGSGAETGLCEHHPEHTAGCGYMEAVEGRRCEHKHTADCCTGKLICSYENEDIQTASDSDGEHKHTLECYELNCQHVHDNECGYEKVVAGHACGYICEICGLEQDSGKVNQETVSSNVVKQECICTAVCTEEQVNTDCPACTKDYTSCMIDPEETKLTIEPSCKDISESDTILDNLLKLQNKQQAMIDEFGVNASGTDEFKTLDEEINALWEHVDACEICQGQLDESGAYYKKFYGTAPASDGSVTLSNTIDLTKSGAALPAAITSAMATWDGSTLTLKGVNIESSAATALIVPGNTTIEVSGQNTISGDIVVIQGKGNMTIQGDGTLTVCANTTSDTASAAIFIDGDNETELKISRTTVNLTGGGTQISMGIKWPDTLLITNNAKVTAVSSATSSRGYGASVTRTKIETGSLKLQGTKGAVSMYEQAIQFPSDMAMVASVNYDGSNAVSDNVTYDGDSGIYFINEDRVRYIEIGKNIAPTKILSSIAVTAPPTKTVYTAGESFDSTGMVVTATYSDSSTSAVTSYTISPSGALKTSDSIVTINYTEGGTAKTATQAITVNASAATIEVTKQPQNKNFAYGSGQSTLNAEGTASNGKPVAYQWYQADGTDKSNAVVISGAQNASFNIPTDLDAGTYYYFCRLSAADCANADTDVATVTVAKAAYPETVSKEVAVRVNQPAAPTGTLTAADFFAAPPAEAKITAVNSTAGTNVLAANSGALSLVNGSLSWTAKDGLTTKDLTDSYTVAISSKNYNDITASLTFKSVDKIPVTIGGISVTGKDYDGRAAAVNGTAGVTVADGGADVTSLAAALDYKWQKKNNDGSYAGLPDAPKDAGSYKLIVSVPDSNQTYEGKTEITFSIAKKGLEIKPEDKSITVGDAMPTFNLKYDGLVAGDTLSPDSGTPVFTCNAQDTNTEGAYAITWNNMDSVTFTTDNYDISKKAAGTLTISKKTSDGGSSNNHSPSGGNSSNNNSSSGSQISKPAQSMTGSTTTNTTVDGNGNANVTVTTQNVNDAISAANAEAAKKGVNVRDVNVVIHVVTDKAATQLTTNLPKIVQDSLISSKVGAIEIKSDTVTMRFSQTAIQQINSQAQADVTITAAKADNSTLTGEARTLVGSRPVFNFTATYGDGKAITNFGTNSVYLAIPYILGQGEKAENVQLYYIDANGALHGQLSTYDTNLKAAVGVTNHFSTYAVGYKPEAQAFNDIANHWAKSDIEFVSARGLLAGTGKTTFSPDSAMTRGMFVTALGRMAGINPDDYKTSSFTDVKASAYYSPYVEWAAQKGIVTGTGNKQFSPDLEVTREQMAVIMVNYAGQMGYSIPAPHKAVTFADSASISEWAAKEVSTMQQAGILMGKDGNRFDPQGKATRAEVSAVLHRFAELIIDPTNAQGWTKNDSGHWLYYRDGTKLIGWQTAGGSHYYFNSDGVMHEGWKEDPTANKWYYWDNNGAATGWKQIDGKWYYFNADGTMAVNTTMDGYQIGEDGTAQDGLKELA